MSHGAASAHARAQGEFSAPRAKPFLDSRHAAHTRVLRALNASLPGDADRTPRASLIGNESANSRQLAPTCNRPSTAQTMP
mmetsp:Transcript_20715/g.50951  ORF Transcript_20715/g.50951 Transcript_20715/m.50951 type:complete len:81 (-) Transcript_20715:147-389(-)|eukprot:5058346-Prymnesium_polylepis.1